MVRAPVGSVLFTCLLALAGCGSSPEETSRFDTRLLDPQPAQMSILSRKFSAETPDVPNFDFDIARFDADALTMLNQQTSWIIDHPHVHAQLLGLADSFEAINAPSASSPFQSVLITEKVPPVKDGFFTSPGEGPSDLAHIGDDRSVFGQTDFEGGTAF